MAPTSMFERLNRALDLISTPMVLEVLDGLGRGLAPADAVPYGTDPVLTAEAVRFLRRIGVVDTRSGPDGGDLVLSDKGWRLLRALEEFDQPNCHERDPSAGPPDSRSSEWQ